MNIATTIYPGKRDSPCYGINLQIIIDATDVHSFEIILDLIDVLKRQYICPLAVLPCIEILLGSSYKFKFCSIDSPGQQDAVCRK